jgi:hypothetical protein
MPRKPQKTVMKKADEAWIIEYLLTGCVKRTDGSDSPRPYLQDAPDYEAEWQAARDELMAVWLKESPATRPWGWWEFDCTTGPRRRLGGRGRREKQAILSCGIPEPTTWWRGVNPAKPPLYESQAAYLQRHKLLAPAEKEWLEGHPEALQPITPEYQMETGPETRPLFAKGSYYEDQETA